MKQLALFAVLAAAGLAGCSSAPPPGVTLTQNQRIYQEYGRSLQVAVAVYESTAKAVGAAHGRKLISDAEHAKILAIERQVHDALSVARLGLLDYLKGEGEMISGDPTSGDLASKFMALNGLLARLFAEAHAAGVIK